MLHQTPFSFYLDSSSSSKLCISFWMIHMDFHALILPLSHKEKNNNNNKKQYIYEQVHEIFQQCSMCDQQSLKSACAYAQSDQNIR